MVEMKDSRSQVPGHDYFEGERLELLWRFVYRPEFIPLLKEYVGVKSGMKVLDSGCGTGFLSRILAKNVSELQVVGVDFDKKLLDIGREMKAREGLGSQIELRQGDAYKLPFPDESFDMTTSQTLL